MHRLGLGRRVRPPTNECPGYDTNPSDRESWYDQKILVALGNLEYLFIAIAPRSILTKSGVLATDRVLSMGWIELFDILTTCKEMTSV